MLIYHIDFGLLSVLLSIYIPYKKKTLLRANIYFILFFPIDYLANFNTKQTKDMRLIKIPNAFAEFHTSPHFPTADLFNFCLFF